jgi:ribosomal protein S18 acetylase RimI-like enzyme
MTHEPTAGVHIRPASIADAGPLLPLIQAYWQHEDIAGFEPARLSRQLDEFLAAPAHGRGWLAMHGALAVGYLLCAFVYSFEHGGLMAEVDELFVQPEYRRQGLGQALLAAARTELTAGGCGALQMQVADDNPGAQDFYRRLGFREKSGYRLWVAALQTEAAG